MVRSLDQLNDSGSIPSLCFLARRRQIVMLDKGAQPNLCGKPWTILKQAIGLVIASVFNNMVCNQITLGRLRSKMLRLRI